MEQKEILEGNKLIAEFMNAKQDQYKQWFGHIGYMGTQVRDFKYNSSWDWIMPVIEKITETIHNPTDEYYHALNHYKHNNYNLFDLGITSSLRAVHNYVVEFIKWHNLQTPKP